MQKRLSKSWRETSTIFLPLTITNTSGFRSSAALWDLQLFPVDKNSNIRHKDKPLYFQFYLCGYCCMLSFQIDADSLCSPKLPHQLHPTSCLSKRKLLKTFKANARFPDSGKETRKSESIQSPTERRGATEGSLGGGNIPTCKSLLDDHCVPVPGENTLIRTTGRCWTCSS